MQSIPVLREPKGQGRGEGWAEAEQLQGPLQSLHSPGVTIHFCSISRGRVSDPAVPTAAPGFGDSLGGAFFQGTQINNQDTNTELVFCTQEGIKGVICAGSTRARSHFGSALLSAEETEKPPRTSSPVPAHCRFNSLYLSLSSHFLRQVQVLHLAQNSSLLTVTV